MLCFCYTLINIFSPGKFHILGRLGETNEVAATITFLASRDASFIHGHDLHVGGGYHCMGPEQTGGGAKFAGTQS